MSRSCIKCSGHGENFPTINSKPEPCETCLGTGIDIDRETDPRVIAYYRKMPTWVINSKTYRVWLHQIGER